MDVRITRLLGSLLAVVGLAAPLSACGDDDPTDDATAPGGDGPATVTIASSRFASSPLRVAPGTTVTFVNTDPFAHTVTSRPGSTLDFGSGALDRSEEFRVTFRDAGSYDYFCEIHPTMRATIEVG